MTTKRYATRDFSDAGTGRSFKAGDDLSDLTAGELFNYEHAGLAGDKPESATVADKAPAGTEKTPAKVV
jgi:hypothetical protein